MYNITTLKYVGDAIWTIYILQAIIYCLLSLVFKNMKYTAKKFYNTGQRGSYQKNKNANISVRVIMM